MNYEAEKIFSFCATNCKKVYDVLDREDLVYECAKMINIENIDKLLSRSHHVVILDIWLNCQLFYHKMDHNFSHNNPTNDRVLKNILYKNKR